ncbi:hypothetical protein [Nocardioides speluncae]|uniref:hypothetical protein n=1 Tax=Nocardioides speluncae TaxID=2670337 RepID=UPI000D68EA12|nr:hypothetical protein [Nocardioides speluncae]
MSANDPLDRPPILGSVRGDTRKKLAALPLGHEYRGGKYGGDYCRVQLARYPCGRTEAEHAPREVVAPVNADDTFTVTLTSAWGDTWTWIGVSAHPATDVYTSLGTPNDVHIVTAPSRHSAGGRLPDEQEEEPS